jgi:hypothetical protein
MVTIFSGRFKRDEDESTKTHHVFNALKPVTVPIGRILNGAPEATRELTRLTLQFGAKRNAGGNRIVELTALMYDYASYVRDPKDENAHHEVVSSYCYTMETHYGYEITVRTKQSDKDQYVEQYRANFTGYDTLNNPTEDDDYDEEEEEERDGSKMTVERTGDEDDDEEEEDDENKSPNRRRPHKGRARAQEEEDDEEEEAGSTRAPPPKSRKPKVEAVRDGGEEEEDDL